MLPVLFFTATRGMNCTDLYEDYLRHYSKARGDRDQFCAIYHHLSKSSKSFTMTSGVDQLANPTIHAYLMKRSLIASNNLKRTSNFPASYDQREQGLSTAVFDQGSCGSCFAVALTYAMEAATLRSIDQYNISYSTDTLRFSVQQLLDQGQAGSCTGGEAMSLAMNVLRLPGLKFASEMPYKYSISSDVGPITGLMPYNNITVVANYNSKAYNATKIELIKQLLSQGLPVLSTVNTQTSGFGTQMAFQNFLGGMFEAKCEKFGADHQIAIVGYGKFKGKDVFLIKNSWGAGWGDHGYYYSEIGADTLCLEHYAFALLPKYFDNAVFNMSAQPKLKQIYTNKITRGLNGLDNEDGSYQGYQPAGTLPIWQVVIALIIPGCVMGAVFGVFQKYRQHMKRIQHHSLKQKKNQLVQRTEE